MCAWPKNVGTTSTSTEESKGASYDTLLKSPETKQTYLQCVLRSINTYIFLINALKKEMLRQDQPCSALTKGDMYTVCVWRLCTIGMTSEYKTTYNAHKQTLRCNSTYAQQGFNLSFIISVHQASSTVSDKKKKRGKTRTKWRATFAFWSCLSSWK